MLRDKMLALMDEVNDEVAEREEVVEGIAIALLTRKNLFLLGGTGQAKSYTIDEFRKRITNSKQFVYLLTKQTDEESIFGRINLSTLIPGNADENILADDSHYQAILSELRDINPDNIDDILTLLTKLDTRKKVLYALFGNKPKLITTGKIPDSHIVFLDEIFKSNESLLNSLLMVLNERRFTNEGEIIDILTISIICAANEAPIKPEDRILFPLYDRLDIKIVTDYIQDDDNHLRILSRKQNEQTGQVTATITLDELYSMQREVASVTIPEAINKMVINIIRKLRGLGIELSDRKLHNYSPIVKAMAWLNGRDTVKVTDLSILRHYLWIDPVKDIPIMQQVLDKVCLNPLQEKLKEITLLAEDSYNEFTSDIVADPTNANAMIKLRKELVHIYRKIMKLEIDANDTADETAVKKVINDIEDMNEEAHEKTGFTYAPLSELQKLL